MLVTKKMLLALSLIGALVGAGIGALATRSTQGTSAANTSYETAQAATPAQNSPELIAANSGTRFNSLAEQSAYRQGFDEGYATCANQGATTSRQVVYRNSQPARTVRRSYNSPRRVYYDYNSAPRGRSFWQKHRDKLTLAIGTGAGAAVGGLIGGKKGAGIGALAGLGSSALYTYKLRKRDRNY